MQIRLLEGKTPIYEIKKLINVGLDIVEKKISELKDIAKESIQKEIEVPSYTAQNGHCCCC